VVGATEESVVFLDDIGRNLKAAPFTTTLLVRHDDEDGTGALRELEGVLRLPLLSPPTPSTLQAGAGGARHFSTLRHGARGVVMPPHVQPSTLLQPSQSRLALARRVISRVIHSRL
jgi:hypothetical protein